MQNRLLTLDLNCWHRGRSEIPPRLGFFADIVLKERRTRLLHVAAVLAQDAKDERVVEAAHHVHQQGDVLLFFGGGRRCVRRIRRLGPRWHGGCGRVVAGMSGDRSSTLEGRPFGRAICILRGPLNHTELVRRKL
jgi:hypothetical protein